MQSESVFVFKPREIDPQGLPFKLAPWILQEATGNSLTGPVDRFGPLENEPNVTFGDSRPAVHFSLDSVLVNGKPHPRITYVWFYPAVTASEKTNASAHQGIRITLDSSGRPGVWEVLRDFSGLRLFFVSDTTEAAAALQFGKPVPARRHVVERRIDQAPDVVVARVIDDGPLPMGPMVYLDMRTRSVATLICRCMPAQAKKLLGSEEYNLIPMQESPGLAPLRNGAGAAPAQTLSWPESRTLEQALRVPSGF